MPTKLDLNATTFDAVGRLTEIFDTHPVGAVLVAVFVFGILLAPALSLALVARARRSSRARHRSNRSARP